MISVIFPGGKGMKRNHNASFKHLTSKVVVRWQQHTGRVWESNLVLAVAQLWVSTSTHQTGTQRPPFFPKSSSNLVQLWMVIRTWVGQLAQQYQKGPILLIPSWKTLKSDLGFSKRREKLGLHPTSPRQPSKPPEPPEALTAAPQESWRYRVVQFSQIFIDHLLSVQRSDQC